MRNVSIFEYRYIPEVVTVLEKLKNIGLKYIEISPIVPIDSEIKLPIEKNLIIKVFIQLLDLNQISA